MADIFLSYVREDILRARAIAGALSAEGWTLWFDQHLHGGADFTQHIQQELDAARCLVVLWSARSVQSKFVRDEAAEGLETNRLVPVRLDESRPPLGFRSVHSLNLSDWTPDTPTDQWRQFIASVESIVPRSRISLEELPDAKTISGDSRIASNQTSRAQISPEVAARRIADASSIGSATLSPDNKRSKASEPAVDAPVRAGVGPIPQWLRAALLLLLVVATIAGLSLYLSDGNSVTSYSEQNVAAVDAAKQPPWTPTPESLELHSSFPSEFSCEGTVGSTKANVRLTKKLAPARFEVAAKASGDWSLPFNLDGVYFPVRVLDRPKLDTLGSALVLRREEGRELMMGLPYLPVWTRASQYDDDKLWAFVCFYNDLPSDLK